MMDTGTLSLFVLAVLALFISPGPNMAFVLSHGLAHGVRGGFAAALGISAADLVHTLCAATGVTALVAAWPPSFDLLRYAGALYLLWLAWQALGPAGARCKVQAQPAGFARIVRMALLNNLVNPKALLFFMVFLPLSLLANFIASRTISGWPLVPGWDTGCWLPARSPLIRASAAGCVRSDR